MARKIDYDLLLRKASIYVVKEILQQVASEGFYKKQHMYITFALNHPDVKVSRLLREDFEDEMTIVLQYEFWDLIVDDYGFSVSLAFDHSDETIYIPFPSIISVTDPSEDFCLDFVPDFTQVRPKTEKKAPQFDNSKKIVSLDEFRRSK